MNSNKKRLLNKTLSLGLTAALTIPFAVLSEQGVKAASTPTTGSIEFSLLDDDGKTLVPSSKVVMKEISNQTGASLVDYSTAWGFNGASDGAITKAALKKSNLDPGKYAVTAQVNANTTVTTFVDVKAGTKATKVTAIGLPASAAVDRKKSGKISATVAALANARIVIKNATTAWITTANSSGYFEVYVPAGSYDIIVDKDKNLSISGLKNNKYSVNVQAGQNNLPFDNMVADSISNDELGLDITESSITPDSKEYKGKANLGTTVRAYTVNYHGTSTADDEYTWIGEAVTKQGASDTVGDFSIKVTQAQPNQNILFVAEDAALNKYSADVYPMGTVDPKFQPDSKAQAGKDVNLTFTDKSGLLAAASDLTVKLKKGSEAVSTYTTLIKDTDYKITNGKLTIKSQAFLDKNPSGSDADTNFDVLVTATGFKDSAVSQIVKATAAPTLSVSVSKATSEGIKVTATATKNTTNTIQYKISNSAEPATPKLYSASPGLLTPLAKSPMDNIVAAANQYLVVYELDSANRIVKFKQTKLTASQIQTATAPIELSLSNLLLTAGNTIETVSGAVGVKNVTVNIANGTSTFAILGSKKDTQAVTKGGAHAASVTIGGTATAPTYTVANLGTTGARKTFTLTVSEGKLGIVVYKVTVNVLAAAPTGITYAAGTNSGTTKLVGVAAGQQYQVNDGGWIAITSTSVDNISAAVGQKIEVRVAASGSNKASLINTHTLTSEEVKP